MWSPLPSYYLGTAPTLTFDPFQPLLWSSSPSGHITSSFVDSSSGLGSRYTAFRCINGIVGEVEVGEKGVLSVGGGKNEGAVRMTSRRGVPIFSVSASSPLSTFAYTPARSSEIIATGVGSDLYIINLHRGNLVRQSKPSIPITQLRRATQLIAATAQGSLVLLDSRTTEFTVQESVIAHTGGISQVEAQDNFIVTIGYTMRQGLPLPDPFLKLHDIRYLRPLSPIPFPSPPALVKFHPRLTSTVVVASAEGRVQLLDLKDIMGNGDVFQVETSSYLSSMAIAPTGEGLAFSDGDGYVHLWSAEEDAKFSRFDGEVELPDQAEPLEQIEWRDDTPLNSIGLPYYDSPLLSLYPPGPSFDYSPSSLHHLPTPIDPAILATVKNIDFVGYASYPAIVRAATRRNQVVGSNGKGKGKGGEAPMFRSEKERNESRRGRDRIVSVDRTETAEVEIASQMPAHYRKVEIKYSRFGVEDFDFGFYNKTAYSGLETHISNSYTNSLLQALHYVKPIKKLAESHIYTSCAKENCLLCEVGFLFRMLGDGKGTNCQASNFSRAFGASNQIAALGLMDHDHESSTIAYASLIQTFNRFLLEQLTAESDQAGHNPQLFASPSIATFAPTSGRRARGANALNGIRPPLAQLLRVEARSVSTCQCGGTTDRDSPFNVVDLVYPRRAMSNEVAPASDYATILRNSIHRETIARMVCTICRQSNHLRIKRIVQQYSNTAPTTPGHPTPREENQMPPCLVINAGVRTADELDIWSDGRLPGLAGNGKFLEPKFSVKVGGDAVVVSTDPAVEGITGYVTYELRSMVVQIQSEGDSSHLVTLARVLEDEKDGSSWHVFNDFLVCAVSQEEALSFTGTWKIPAVLFYQRVDAKKLLDYSTLPSSFDTAILCQDITVSRNRDPHLVKHQPFRPDELPRRGTLISIDAEFVSLQQEEAEFHSDGTKNVIRPSRMTLARVSVLRGEGPDTGIPFIDDHIHTSETVVDYLTEFSGIRAGDLDPFLSRHTLVPLKVAYKKLRLLVDLGCVFIGHGLNKDFRIINIFIPPAQIIDTVNIYYLASRSRKLSLRFLAFAVLHSAIQTDTHDSIEDARTALQLYETQQREEAEGSWEDTLEDIYREGRLTNFKVPGTERPGIPASANNSIPSSPARTLLSLGPAGYYSGQQQQSQMQQQGVNERQQNYTNGLNGKGGNIYRRGYN